MNFNNLKRKAFFWLEKLQISQKERIAFALLLGILVILFSMSLLLQNSFNYDQNEYDRIVAEFERKSALIHQQEKEQAAKFIPQLNVNETDEQPSETQTTTAESKTTDVAEEASAPILININTASSSELQTLDGIGPAYAQNIIDYREANGDFGSIDELTNVRGIGEKRLENIRPFIILDE